jgi:hypothetical protein
LVFLPDIKRRMLKDISREEDVESSTRKLLDQVAKLNDERFHATMKLKVSRAFMLTNFFSCLS